jgi:hypothetical protein
MRYQYRVTKYNPAFRDINGAFKGLEWTSYSDIGKSFNGAKLTEEQYLEVETVYLNAIESFLNEAKIESLVLRGLENHTNTQLPQFVQPNAVLEIPECVQFARIVLREQAWGRLVNPKKAYVHFGYDYYMYIGLPKRCIAAESQSQKSGLFVEPFRSPYLRSH